MIADIVNFLDERKSKMLIQKLKPYFCKYKMKRKLQSKIVKIQYPKYRIRQMGNKYQGGGV